MLMVNNDEQVEHLEQVALFSRVIAFFTLNNLILTCSSIKTLKALILLDVAQLAQLVHIK